MRRGHDKITYKDPVCGMTLSQDSAVEDSDHQGHTYFFCSRSYREPFDTDPGRFEIGRRPVVGSGGGKE